MTGFVRILLVPFLLLPMSSGWAQQSEPVTTADLLRLREITAIDVASDGSFAVVALKSIATSDKEASKDYAYRSHLWRLELNSPGKARPLTYGKRLDRDPQLSPDASLLAFVRQEAGEDQGQAKSQVWVLPMNHAGEAYPITDLEHGADTPRWRPDGQALCVTSRIPFSHLPGQPAYAMERPQRDWRDVEEELQGRPDGNRAEIRKWLSDNAAQQNPAVLHRLRFQAEQALQEEPKFHHLFLVTLDDAPAVALTLQTEESLQRNFRHYRSPSWAPDGQTILYVDVPQQSTHPDRLNRSAIFAFELSGRRSRLLLDSLEWTYRNPRFSRQGDWIYFRATAQDWPSYRQAKLGRIRSQGSPVEWLARGWPSGVNRYQETSSGALWFRSNWQGGQVLVEADSNGFEVLIPAPMGVRHFAEGGGVTVAAVTQPRNPCELYRLEANGELTQLSFFNHDWLQAKQLSLPKVHWLEREDGTRIQYWVMEPTNRQPGKAYPVVLEIHGGPAAMWGPGEFTMWHEFQLLCSWGYGVVYSNPRGSGGYGFDFQAANHQNWGHGPAGDVLACMEDAVRKYGWIDSARQFVTGGSYAGYLTAWIVAHDHRFLAAVAQRGVYDLRTFFGEGNAWRLIETAFGGLPWDALTADLLQRESPLSYVHEVRTPLLILHASQDLRTGVSQSEMLYRSLKRMGRPVEYVRYPGAGHDLSRTGHPMQRMDRLNRIVEFFERYAANERPAPVENRPSE